MMLINNKYDFGDMVYLKTDEEQAKRIVTGITIQPNGCLLYELALGVDVSSHYEFEISLEADLVERLK